MSLADPYVWIDPADAVFVASCREALAIERKAYAAADAERRAFREAPSKAMEAIRAALQILDANHHQKEPSMEDGHALRNLGDRLDNAQVGATGRFWQLCEAQERGEHPSADKRVLVGLTGRRIVRLMFGVLLRDLTRTPAVFTLHLAALANGMVREVGECLQPLPFKERLNAFNGLVQQLADGLQLGIAEKAEAAPEPAPQDPRQSVITAAVALSKAAAEFRGDLSCCGEHLDALQKACDRLDAAG